MEVYFVAYTCGKQGAFVGIDNEVNRYVCDRILKFQNIVQHYVRYRILSSFIVKGDLQKSSKILLLFRYFCFFSFS